MGMNRSPGRSLKGFIYTAGVKVPPWVKFGIRSVEMTEGIPESEVVRRALEEYFDAKGFKPYEKKSPSPPEVDPQGEEKS